MFLHKLRVVANFCQKQGLVRDVLRSQSQPTLPLPTISIIARQFASRFSEDDDDDYVPRNHTRQRRPANNQRGFGYDRNQNVQSKFGDNQFSPNRFSPNRFNRDRFSPMNANNRNPNNQSFGGLPKPDWDLESLEEIQKDFYQPHEKTLNRSDEEIKKFYDEHEITVPLEAPKPILEFDELTNVPKSLLDVIKKHNFVKASPIQAQGWPIALSGKNLVGIAQTG